MEAVLRRDDGELLGFVVQQTGEWLALAVFGAVLGRHGRREDAVQQVHHDGLASLAERWTLRRGGTEDEEVVCIVEANPDAVTVALGYYSLPGVPTLTISAAELRAGQWALRRAAVP
jgi:hypothetical protein